MKFLICCVTFCQDNVSLFPGTAVTLPAAVVVRDTTTWSQLSSDFSLMSPDLKYTDFI